MNTLAPQQVYAFQQKIWSFYAEYGRQFAWRNVQDPYTIVVSEIMLQQTQTYRVKPKFEQFIAEFPTFNALAQASLRDVLTLWQGLGYNRRAKFLHQLAQKITTEHNGVLPASPDILCTLPGIGKATAGSICAFAFNMPTVFIETNIRAVYIHTFFKDQEQISDKQLMPLIAQTVDHINPREWYYGIMDYGVELKKRHKNPSRQSRHHAKQTKFEGSTRQIRGAIVRLLTEHKHLSKLEIIAKIADSKNRTINVIDQLSNEGFITHDDGNYWIV